MTATDSTSVVFSGYLTKLGKNFPWNWKLRFFELRGYQISYFESPAKRTKPLGVVELYDAQENIVAEYEILPDGKRKYLFSVGLPHKRKYFISANDDETRRKWISVIKQVVDKLASQHGASLTATKRIQNKEEQALKDIEEASKKLELARQTLLKQKREAYLRKWIAVFRFRRATRSIKELQTIVSTVYMRTQFESKLKSTVLLQSIARKRLQLKKYLQARKRSQMRRHILNEILLTEQSYVSSLRLVEELYIIPLMKGNIVNAQVIPLLFSNIQFILQIHLSFLEDLKKRTQTLHPHCCIGDLFERQMVDFKPAYLQYIKSYDKSIENITKQKDNNEQFQKFLQETKLNPRANLLELNDFLIMPVQRLPRYELLLQDVRRNSEPQCADSETLQNVVSQLKQVTYFINEQKREFDSQTRMLELREKLVGGQKLMHEGRKLIKEGPLFKINLKAQKEVLVYCFLCNDMFIISTSIASKKLFSTSGSNKYELKKQYPITGLSKVQDSGHYKDHIKFDVNADLCFGLDSFQASCFRADSFAEKKSWVSALMNVISAAPKEVPMFVESEPISVDREVDLP